MAVVRILGIETSCDETAVAIVENGCRIRANLVANQDKLHAPYQGVVPELASRQHLEKINHLISRAFRETGYGITNLDAVAVTRGPGLIGSLLIGNLTAQALHCAARIPLIGVHHLEGHLYAAVFTNKRIGLPFLGLIVSGGHTELILVQDWGKYRLLGATRDDAAGEAFDKVAKLLNLGYPGGPRIEQAAKKGNPTAINFPRAYLPGSWDFSFSGLKTAVINYLRKRYKLNNSEWFSRLPFNLPADEIADICASFQAAVVAVLVTKTLRAAEEFGINTIVVGGGVAANQYFRKEFLARGKGKFICFPSSALSTDNAAMIAGIAYAKYQKQIFTTLPYSVDPNQPIQSWE